MILNNENYFSKEADWEYMSVSQFKLFEECEAKALATIKGQEDSTQKEAFLEGQLFEELVSGDAKLFIAKHPELISSRGATAGQLKSGYAKVLAAAKKFNSQKFFTDIIGKCEKQTILVGEFCDIKVKCKLDLFDRKTNSIYDIKCMKDFKESWDKSEKIYKPWYYTYNYVLQLAVYKEIVKQNFDNPKEVGLLAATKEEIPDIQALCFSKELLDLELEKFKRNINRYNDIKLGKIKPNFCGCCDYCKTIKNIKEFEVIK
ncbi:MAG: PD-(D/E)XK nuclease-like domain-containing protein [Clostridia bacterium]